MREFLIQLFAQILAVATPAFREQLVKFCIEYRDAAKKTPNPWDDILANLLCWMVGVA